MAEKDWFFHEKTAWVQGYSVVAGVDEAGRGPLAGPVFAAAVVLNKNDEIAGLDDSKKLTECRREALFEEITKRALVYSVASASEAEIDELNILQATYLAMKRAISGLSTTADFILIDGNGVPPGFEGRTKAVVGGDGLSASIAAASILAKVSRDRHMQKQAGRFPQYFFEKHKGYGTALHRDLILKFGPCEIHRRAFLRKILGDGS